MADNIGMLSEGDVIAERYMLVRELGRGGMGCVFEAFDQRLKRPVALKFLNHKSLEDSKQVSRFQREALAAGRIRHGSICDVRDLGEIDEGTPFIVMELLEGISLEQLFREETRLDVARAGRLVLQTLSGLWAAHQAGIVHRDLKPGNLFVTRDVEGLERIKILDFGLSKFLSESVGERLTHSGIVMGTPLFMSPEQAGGSADIDHRTDIWSVGVVLYEILTGKTPFDGQNYNEILVKIIMEAPASPKIRAPNISDEIEAVVFKALTKNREERYQSALEFGMALTEALENDGLQPWSSQPPLTDSLCTPDEPLVPDHQDDATDSPDEAIEQVAPIVAEEPGTTVRESALDAPVASSETEARARMVSRRSLGALILGLGVLGAVVVFGLMRWSGSDDSTAPTRPEAKASEGRGHIEQQADTTKAASVTTPTPQPISVGEGELSETGAERSSSSTPTTSAGARSQAKTTRPAADQPRTAEEEHAATQRDISGRLGSKLATEYEPAPASDDSEDQSGSRAIKGKHGSVVTTEYPGE